MATTTETRAWLAAYGNEEEKLRRRKEMPEKLRRLRVEDLPRGSRVLDLCCGHGEALDALYEMGFRDLNGIDLSITKELADDARFSVKSGDALDSGFPDASFDLVLNIHAMHHFRAASSVKQFLDESFRLLKPGGKLAIVDFPDSIQIRLAFWWFRQKKFLLTPYLRYFSEIINEEWVFLEGYLDEWPQVWSYLMGSPFVVKSLKRDFFYFYLVLGKPGS